MTSEDATEPSTLPRRQLARFLREKREGVGLSIAKAAALVELSQAALQRIEAAKTQKVRAVDVQALCDLYEVPKADTAHAVELAKQSRVTSWYTAFAGLYSDPTFNMHVELTASAHELISYQEIVLGLLQTPDYARALISDFYRDDSPEHIERRVELRMRRQPIVTRKADPVRLELLLHESALHRVVGGPRVMAAQLRHLAEIGKRPNISIRIHPFSAGYARGLLHGPFVILKFGSDAKGRPTEPPLVYFEGHGKPDIYLESADDYRRYDELASTVRSTALDEVKSRDLLRRVAREYEA
ncbi:helix-turn-helix domain-containing protein [Nocardia cyriacigeorgica]|uniref:Helix-turn-helix domain-containing protein n=1 Tax=Nocardia cyriacigeorgica TaxID=135487 RepID=A0A6P1DBZ8_9NOCA|nr:helix-turn-helix transcriptional regulator [Nocardia cyriacigeorgica]NEW42197.1 helix-turn-helix domain-containing protein [Nocardia cyriacigeorgica]NEW47109.1 helix-turn-helix domain-containing protein [Nocardia cyriacigeorgica]NEW53215.1 helix-turn-helix domain-containing protein [Nocardia cyriacigeorgica]NEW55973.1 helix-turn-helix domain-containing protein [Nocardia cyriacigeorgica]